MIEADLETFGAGMRLSRRTTPSATLTTDRPQPVPWRHRR
jgi:hypothetical protein